jgi:tetratricopeptide (TPR) repeat protein
MIEGARVHRKIGTRSQRILRLHSTLIAGVSLLLCAPACCAQDSPAQENERQAALVLEQQGKNAEAEAEWRTYLKTHPSSSEAYAHLGLLEAREQNYKQAVVFYRKALALHATVPGLRLNLGLALFKAGEMEEAVREFLPLFRSAPVSSPDRQRLAILVGMSYYGLGEHAKAVPYLKAAVSGDPQNLPLRLALAHSCLWSKQYQCVLDTYHDILLLNAESAEADMLAGEALDEMKDVSGAIQQFRAAAKADPQMPDVHFGLGYLLWTKRQYPDAAPEFQAELHNNPHHAQALTYLGDVDLQLNHSEAAQPLLEKAIQIDPAIELAHLDLGAIDADAGRRDDALRELMTAVRLAPNDVNAHWRLGRLYKAMGKQQEAKTEFDKTKSITVAADTALINKIATPPVPAHPSPVNGK